MIIAKKTDKVWPEGENQDNNIVDVFDARLKLLIKLVETLPPGDKSSSVW